MSLERPLQMLQNPKLSGEAEIALPVEPTTQSCGIAEWVAVSQTVDPPQISCYEVEAVVQVSLCGDLLQVGQAVHVCGQKLGHKFACEQRTNTHG